MRLAYAVVIAAAIGCKQKDPPAQGSGSGSAIAPVPAAKPPPAIATIDEKALDAALAANGIKPDAVKQRKVGAHSAWALVAAPRDKDNEVVEFDLLRVDGRGTAMLPLTPTPRKAKTWWNIDTTPLDVRDLDGDGTDECLLVLEWVQDIPDTTTGEGAKQLFVIGGARPDVAATAIIDYSTLSQQATDHDTEDPPAAEHVAFDWKADGKTLTLTRTENQLNAKRAPGLTDPKTDPLLAGGTIPIHL